MQVFGLKFICFYYRLAFFKAAYALFDSDFYVKADDDIYLRPGEYTSEAKPIFCVIYSLRDCIKLL